MSDIKKLQKEILGIVKNFARGRQTTADVKRLAEILYYDAPIQNKVLPGKFKQEQISVEVVQNIGLNKEDKNVVTSGTHSKGHIELSFDAIKNLGEELNTLGHEGTHEIQEMVVRARAIENIELTPELAEIADSYEYGATAQTNLYGMVNLSANQELDETLAENSFENFENMEGEERAEALKKAKSRLNHISYKQLKYEESARDCGYEYAREILSAIKDFKQCDSKTRAYIEECEKELSRKWEREENLRNSGTYQTLRKLHQASITACSKLDAQKLDRFNLEPTLKAQLQDGILFHMRRAHVSKAEYYRALVAFNRSTELEASDEISFYYLTDCNPKEVVMEALKDGTQSEDFALQNINFLIPKDTILLTPEDISELCLHWAKQGKIDKIYSILDLCNEDPDSSLMKLLNFSPYLSKERQESIIKSISENYELFETIDKEYNELLTKYKAIKGKEPSQMNDEELALCANSDRFQALKAIRNSLGIEEKESFTPHLQLPQGQCILDEQKRRKEAAKQQETLETPVVEEETSTEETSNDGTSIIEETKEDTQEHLEDNPQTEETEEEIEHSTE